MHRLFIIGNGFDRYFDLPTKTDHFVEELKKISFEKCESAWDAYLNCGVNWSTFEGSLADIDLNIIEDEVLEYPDYMSEREGDRDAVILKVRDYADALFDAREKALRKMIDKAENEIGKIKTNSNSAFFKDDDEIISFNYTSTIESLFDYNKEIFHIHGRYSDDEKLVFGFREESAEFRKYKLKLNTEMDKSLKEEILEIKNDKSIDDDKRVFLIDEIQYCYDQEWNDSYVDREYEEIVSFYEENKKNFQYEKLERYLDGLDKIDEVVVLGHSMGDVDREYFEKIEERKNPKKWLISVHSLENKNDEALKIYSFYKKVEIDTMQNILEKPMH